MKNLKIYKKIVNKGKFVLLPISISVTILFSGCSFFPNGERAKYSNTKANYTYSNDYSTPTVPTKEEITTSEVNNNSMVSDNLIVLDNYNIPMSSIKDGKLTQTYLKFSNNNYNEMTEYIDSLNTYYDYENLYNFSDSLKEYNKLIFTNKHNDDLKDITVDDLASIIKNNNKKYKEEIKTALYKDLNSNEINEICEIIVATVNNFMENNKDISIDRIKCVLSDLKLFKQTSSMCNAFVTDNNCLIVSPNMMQVANVINGEGTEKDVLVHETIHLLQKGCNCDLNNNPSLKRNFGISYGFKDIKINSLDITWLYEAAAEKNMVNYTGHEPLTYKNMIGYLESLSLVNLLNDNYKVNDTENLTFKRSLDDLYNYFNITSDKDKKEILNMMYSIEVMQQAPDEFYSLLEEQTGKIKDEALIDEVNYTVKSPICITLSKLFYKNLSKNIVNKKVTLEDVFYLISIFENDLNKHILYSDSSLYTYTKEFIESYVNIQDNFFYQLSKCLNCTQEEIEKNFYDYTSKIRTDEDKVVNNCSLEFLTEEKIDYLNEREIALNSASTIQIRLAKEQLSKNNSQKMYK